MAKPKKVNRYEEYEFAKDWLSVTTVTAYAESKEGLAKWRGYVGNKKADHITQSSIKIGHAFDAYRDYYFTGGTSKFPDPDLDKDNIKYFNQVKANFHDFVDKYKPERVADQLVVYSKKHEYIGSLDEIWLINDDLILVDGKATNQLNYGYKLQVEAYYRALTEMQKGGIIKDIGKVKKLWVVQFPKKCKIDLKEKTKHIYKLKPDIRRFTDGFLGLLNMLYYKRRDK